MAQQHRGECCPEQGRAAAGGSASRTLRSGAARWLSAGRVLASNLRAGLHVLAKCGRRTRPYIVCSPGLTRGQPEVDGPQVCSPGAKQNVHGKRGLTILPHCSSSCSSVKKVIPSATWQGGTVIDFSDPSVQGEHR